MRCHTMSAGASPLMRMSLCCKVRGGSEREGRSIFMCLCRAAREPPDSYCSASTSHTIWGQQKLSTVKGGRGSRKPGMRRRIHGGEMTRGETTGKNNGAASKCESARRHVDLEAG